MLGFAIAKFLPIRKGLRVKRVVSQGAKSLRARAFAPAVLFVLAACSNLPRIGGEQLPPETNPAPPVYRNLADIPEPPPVAPMEANEKTIQALTEDRAKTAQAATDLRRQPFMQPDSATKPGF